MATRDDIVDAALGLALSTGARPSLQAVATTVGLTKQGILHYFPTRAALDDVLVERSVQRVDDLMTEAAREGNAVETYLRLSSPTKDERAVAVTVLAMTGGAGSLPAIVGEAVSRWEALMSAELGDPAVAEAARLTADGLFAEALVTGVPVSAQRVDRLLAVFTDHSRGAAGQKPRRRETGGESGA